MKTKELPYAHHLAERLRSSLRDAPELWGALLDRALLAPAGSELARVTLEAATAERSPERFEEGALNLLHLLEHLALSQAREARCIQEQRVVSPAMVTLGLRWMRETAALERRVRAELRQHVAVIGA